MLGVGQWLLSALLLISLGSFAWAMQKFFTRPAGKTLGMMVIAVCGTIFAVLHLIALLSSSITFTRGMFGAILYLASAGLFWWAIRASLLHPLSASFSPDAPQHLVETGPYRLMRHPLYLSYLLTWLAAPIATGRWLLVLTFATMAAIYLSAALMEENKFIRGPLADSYLRYRSHTGLLVPNVIKLASALSHGVHARLDRSQNVAS